MTLDDQKKLFPAFVDTPNEVIDAYYNSFLLLPDLVNDAMFSNSVLAELIRIQNYISIVMAQSSVQAIEEKEVDSNKEWIILRSMSKNVLELLDEPMVPPDMNYI